MVASSRQTAASCRIRYNGIRYTCGDASLASDMMAALAKANAAPATRRQIAANIERVKKRFTPTHGGCHRTRSIVAAAPLPPESDDAVRRRLRRKPKLASADSLATVMYSAASEERLGGVSGQPDSEDQVQAHGARMPLAASSKGELSWREATFTVEAPLGSGSFGRVYHAVLQPPFPTGYEEEQATPAGARLPAVAMKVVSKTAGDSEQIAWAREELTTLTKVKGHSHVAKLLFYRESDFNFQLALHIGHCDLFAYLQRKTLDHDAGKTLCSQMVSALTHVHSKHILHRDIKSQNIVIQNAGLPLVALLVDFGWATDLDLRGDADVLEEIVATPPYRAPEISLSPRKYGYPMDVWALGVTLAESEMGTPPFSTDKSVPASGLIRSETRDRLINIFRIIGTPTRQSWPELFHSVSAYHDVLWLPMKPSSRQPWGRRWGEDFRKFIAGFLALHPAKRTMSSSLWLWADVP